MAVSVAAAGASALTPAAGVAVVMDIGTESLNDDCDGRPTTHIAGTLPDEYHELRPQDNRKYDLRDLTSIGKPFVTTDPFILGEEQHSRYLCVLGGTVQGSSETDNMLRDVVKQRWTGPGMYVAGVNDHPTVVDGLRIDRSEDGYALVGDGFVLRNAYFSNIRDDCVENDFLSAGLIEDSLFDGCFAGISTDTVVRPSPINPDPLVLDGVLMRVKPFPRTPTTIQHISLFKPRPNSPKPVVVRNSVLLADEWSRPGVWPPDFETENVTLVWLGDGPFPRPIPDGTTVVTDLSVWEDAREDWLVSHGYEPLPDSPTLVPAPDTADGQVSLTWSLGSGADSYQIKRSASSGGPYETIAEVDASGDRTYTDATVEPGVRYFYAVSAVNGHGESDNSNEAIAVTVPDTAGAPAAAHNLIATVDPIAHGQQHRGRVDLSWNHVAGAEEYVVRRGTEPGQYDWEIVTRGNTYTSVGLGLDTTYYYQVEAHNRHGTGAPSEEASATTVRPQRDLPAPVFHPWQQEAASGDAVVAGDGQITLSWLFPRDAGLDIVYTIKRATTPGGPYEDVAQVGDGTAFPAPTYTDTGLDNGVTYYYVIQATDGSGSSPDSEEVFETPQASPVIPAAPSELDAALDTNGVLLSWDEAALATHYTIARAASPDGPFEPVYGMVADTTYIDYGIQPDQDYFYQVSAANSFGQSDPSPTAQASVGALDHTPPVVTVVGVEDQASYTLGAVPTPDFSASDDGNVAWQGDELRPPDTATGVGQYSYVATARDDATNETIIYTTYDVRYQFGGFLGAVSEPGWTFPSDEPIPVIFRLNDAADEPVTGAVYTILVDGVPATPWRERPGGSYIFLLDPRDLSEELHTLALVLDDGTMHQTTFRLGTGG